MKATNYFAPLLIVGLLLLGYACTRSLESPAELQDFIADQRNGLTKEKSIGELKIRLIHRPTDLLVQQELGQQTATAELIDSLRKQYDAYLYFLLSLSANGKEVEHWQVANTQQFSQRVQTLAFGMSELVNLSSNFRDSIPLVDFVYQRTFGGGTASSVLFAFDRTALAEADWLSFQLQDIGLGIGTTRFKFDAEAIRETPNIQFIQQWAIDRPN